MTATPHTQFIAFRGPGDSRQGGSTAFSSASRRRSISCMSCWNHTGTDHSAPPWERYGESPTDGPSVGQASKPPETEPRAGNCVSQVCRNSGRVNRRVQKHFLLISSLAPEYKAVTEHLVGGRKSTDFRALSRQVFRRESRCCRCEALVFRPARRVLIFSTS